MLTIKDLARITGVSIPTINYMRQKYKIHRLFKMVKIRHGKRANLQWVLEDDDLPVFEEFIEERKRIRENKIEYPKNRIHWTRSSAECYNANMICAECINNIACEMIANVNIAGVPDKSGLKPMKWMVMKLFSLYGKPPEKPEEQTDV